MKSRPTLRLLLTAIICTSAASISSADSSWEKIECVPADLTNQLRFQPVRMIDDIERSTQNWTPLKSDQCAQATVHRDRNQYHGGRSALRVDYRFDGESRYEYIQLQGKAEFAQPGLGFGFWLKHDGVPFSLRLRFVDSSGENHQTELIGLPTETDWQFVAGMLDTKSDFWGGDGNGRKDYPCRLSGIVIDRPQSGFTATGSLWIDDLMFVQPRKQQERPFEIATKNRRFGNQFTVGENVMLQASGAGDEIRWQVVDYFGNVQARGKGPAKQTSVEFPLQQPGWFSCQFILIADRQIVGSRSFDCAALPPSDDSPLCDFVGVCTHFGQNRYPLDCMDMMLRYGIDQYRDEIGWSRYEQQPGEYSLPDYAADYLRHSAKLKMRPLVIFDYSNRHYDHGNFPNSPEAIQGFANYAVALARETKGTVGMFEVWNEWIGGCGMKERDGQHDAAAYGRLLKPTYAAVKAKFPELTVVGIGGEYGKECAENIAISAREAGPQSMDGWSIHPYRYPHSPELSDLVGEVNRIASRVGQEGVKTKAWITEIGYPTHLTNRGSTPAAQARHCVRTLALLQSTGLVEKVFWYDLKDDGHSREEKEHNFGLVHHQQFNCAPKPGMVAMSVFARSTAGWQFRELKQAGTTYVACYRRPDGQDLLIAWTSQGKAMIGLKGQLNSAFDIMGKSLEPAENVEISVDPIYFVGKDLNAAF